MRKKRAVRRRGYETRGIVSIMSASGSDLEHTGDPTLLKYYFGLLSYVLSIHSFGRLRTPFFVRH